MTKPRKKYMKKTTSKLSLTTNLSKLNGSAFSGLQKQNAAAGTPASQGINFGLPANRKALLQTSASGTTGPPTCLEAGVGSATSAFSGARETRGLAP